MKDIEYNLMRILEYYKTHILGKYWEIISIHIKISRIAIINSSSPGVFYLSFLPRLAAFIDLSNIVIIFFASFFDLLSLTFWLDILSFWAKFLHFFCISGGVWGLFFGGWGLGRSMGWGFD